MIETMKEQLEEIAKPFVPLWESKETGIRKILHNPYITISKPQNASVEKYATWFDDRLSVLNVAWARYYVSALGKKARAEDKEQSAIELITLNKMHQLLYTFFALQARIASLGKLIHETYPDEKPIFDVREIKKILRPIPSDYEQKVESIE